MSSSQTLHVLVRSGFVVVNDLADLLNMDRSSCRRAVIKAGYKPTKMRLASTGGQFVNVITQDEAERFVRDRRNEFVPDVKAEAPSEKLTTHEMHVRATRYFSEQARIRRDEEEARIDAVLYRPHQSLPRASKPPSE